MLQSHLDKLVSWSTQERFKPDVALARKDFFLLTGGEVFEDDRSVENRLSAFVDWYIFDRPRPEEGATPAQAFIEACSPEIHPSELPIYRGFTETVRGLFELKRIGKDSRLKVRDLCADREYEVLERRTPAGLAKGDVFEARLIPYQGELLFSAAFCYHPRAARKAILAEVKRRRKLGPIEPAPLLNALLAMALKFERYRNVAVEAIYAFDPKRAKPK